MVSKTDDNFKLALAEGATPIVWANAGTITHTWRKVGYETTLKEDLNKTDTTIELVSAAFPTAWPSTGVIKLGTEYISYAAISTNNLTGCVRGYYESKASEHKGPRIKGIAGTPTGTNYGFDDSSNFSSANVVLTSYTNPTNTNKLQLNLDNQCIYSGYLALGCIIKGKTINHEAISTAIFTNLQRISIENNMPIRNGIFNANNIDEAKKKYKKCANQAANVIHNLLNY